MPTGLDRPEAPPTQLEIEHALLGEPFFIIGAEDRLILQEIFTKGRAPLFTPFSDFRAEIAKIQNPTLRERLLDGRDTAVAFPTTMAPGVQDQGTALDRVFFGQEHIVYASAISQSYEPFEFHKIRFGRDRQGQLTWLFTNTGSPKVTRISLDRMAELMDQADKLRKDLEDAERRLAKTQAAELAATRTFSRRRLLQFATAGLGVGILIGSPRSPVAQAISRIAENPSLPDILRPQEPESKVERLRDLPGLEAVLAASLREKDAQRGTQKDNLIDPFTVLRQFLGGKFWYTGRAKDEEGQRVHRFAIIGERSKYLDRDGQGKDRFNSTTLSDAINNLLDYERLTDTEIKKWIVFTYKHSFGGENLQADRITIQRDKKTKKVTGVSYNPQPGFERKILLGVPKEIEGVSPSSMQGMPTTKRDYYSILGAGNRLVLQSGISPDHDLYVPANLLDPDKRFKLPIGKRGPNIRPEGYGQFGSYELSATQLAEAIHWQEERTEKNGHARVEGSTSDGRSYSFASTASFVPTDSPAIKTIADFLIQTIKDTDRERYVQMGITNPKAQEVQRLTEYVQSMDYVWENDNNFNRHPLITLFNEGSDCNNKTILWSALLAARKHDHAILYIANRKYSYMSHVLGGIDASIIPPPAQNDTSSGVVKKFRRFAVVESTSPFSLGRTFERAEIEKEIAAAEWLHFDPAGNLQIDIVR